MVAGVCGPDDGELGLAGPGGAVGLFPLPALGLGLADGDAGAVEAEIEGVCVGGFGFDDAALVLGDGFSEGFGLSFHQLGFDVETGQHGQEFAALGEADSCRDAPGHAQRGGREGGGGEPESAIAGSEALGAAVAVIPGAVESERAEGGGEGLGPAAGVAGLGSTTTDNTTPLVRVIGVEATASPAARERSGNRTPSTSPTAETSRSAGRRPASTAERRSKPPTADLEEASELLEIVSFRQESGGRPARPSAPLVSRQRTRVAVQQAVLRH